MDLGEYLKKYTLSVLDFEALSGVHHKTIYRILSGSKRVSVKTIRKIRLTVVEPVNIPRSWE